MNYQFAQKNHWRRRMWNLLRERVSVHPRDAIILYFPSEQDLDRPVALEKGFHSNNLIAIERDWKVVESLRSRGVLTIHGEFSHVIMNWPESEPVHGVFADYVCGITNLTALVCFLVFGAAGISPESPVIFNFLRGRDLNGAVANVAREISEITKTKHRGILALTVALFIYLISLGYDDRECAPRLVAAVKSLDPVTHSYRSGVQTFDSVVFKTLPGSFPRVPGKNLEMRRQIAAVLAHRTRRMKQKELAA